MAHDFVLCGMQQGCRVCNAYRVLFVLLLLVLVLLQVRAVFEQLLEPEWLVQDASQSIDEIHQQVRVRMCCRDAVLQPL